MTLWCRRARPQRGDGRHFDPDSESCALAIVDVPASPHGQRMARVLRPTTPVIWIPPTLSIGSDLLATRARVVALPLRLRGGNLEDTFTVSLLDVLERLRDGGCLVFVAQGPHRNLLAEVAIRVRAPSGDRHLTASEACIAAAERALLRIDLARRIRHG